MPLIDQVLSFHSCFLLCLNILTTCFSFSFFLPKGSIGLLFDTREKLLTVKTKPKNNIISVSNDFTKYFEIPVYVTKSCISVVEEYRSLFLSSYQITFVSGQDGTTQTSSVIYPQCLEFSHFFSCSFRHEWFSSLCFCGCGNSYASVTLYLIGRKNGGLE